MKASITAQALRLCGVGIVGIGLLLTGCTTAPSNASQMAVAVSSPAHIPLQNTTQAKQTAAVEHHLALSKLKEFPSLGSDRMFGLIFGF